MSIVKALFDKSVCNASEVFGVTDKTTQAMQDAIKDWFDLYYDREVTKDEDPCQRIPYTIVRKLTKTVFSEYTASSEDAFVQDVLASLNERRKPAVELAMIGGSMLLKPVAGEEWRWTLIRRTNVLVFGRDADGKLTDIGTAERTQEGLSYYTLYERRTVDANGFLTIKYKLFRSPDKERIGTRVPLATLDKYAELPDEYTYTVPFGLGVVEVKIPIANCVDDSEDGVSVYAAAAGLIHNINTNEAQLSAEFRNGRSRIIASSDMLTKDDTGHKAIKDDLFTAVDDDPDIVGITIFSPALREESFIARKESYLRSCESMIGLKRGLLSEVEAQERTAKEITSSEGDYNLTITDLQDMWEGAVKDAVKLCGTLGKLYRVSGAHEVDEDDIGIDWGNGILYDEDKTWADYKDLVARGLLRPEFALGWRFSMPTDTPEEREAIRQKYMPELKQLTGEGEE